MRPFVLGLLLCACSSDPPPGPVPLKTATMAATITVVADGATTKSNIVILAGDTLMEHFVLAMGDALTTSKPAMSMPMAAMGMGMTLEYEAAFPGTDAEGTMYTIAFNRTADKGAPNSVAVLPAPLTLSLPADGMSFSRAMDDVVVNYAPSGFADPVSWFIQGTCVQVAGMQGVTGDSGNFTIARGGLKNAGAGGTCMATLTVYRTRKGTLDPGFGKGGSVTAQQIARVSITSKT